MSKTMTLPFVSNKRFSGEKSDLIMLAVPYLLTELFEMMLKPDDMVLQVEKESSVIFTS